MQPEDDFRAEDVAIERALRISELRAELATLTGEPIAEHLADAPEVDPETAFIQEMEAIEGGLGMPLADILRQRRNYTPVPPAKLDDPIDLRENLWLLLYTLASIRVFVSHTNHLSDAELYEVLVNDLLSCETTVLPEGSAWNCRFTISDFTEKRNGSDDCYFRFYADEDERHYFADEFPEMDLPPKEEPPYDRDDSLPTIH